MEILTVANQKGGVGKTTTAVNLAASLAVLEKRVLLIDMDAQANATRAFGFRRSDFESNIYHVLSGKKNIEDIKLKTQLEGLFLVPSNIGLAAIEGEADHSTEAKLALKNALKSVGDYDFIIIDSPPALGNITMNALAASTGVIIPVQCEFYALDGVALILKAVAVMKNSINPGLKIKGILPTMFSSQNNLSKMIIGELEQHFMEKIFKANGEIIVVPRNVKLAESPSFGKPAILYDIKSPGSRAYMELAEIMVHQKVKRK